MNNRYAVIHKSVGQTPLEAVALWKEKGGIPRDLPVSYAGRLDPMAHGKLLVLLGDECKKQKLYTGLDKEYEVEVLLDIGTDTGDVLGMPSLFSSHADTGRIQSALRDELGTHLRTYPIFSSKTVNGKPLFMYALENTLHTIATPEHPETFYRISLRSIETLSSTQLAGRVADMLALTPTSDEPSKALGADFRIGTIRPKWAELFKESEGRTFTILKIRVVCGSGAYMRSLAGRIGERLGSRGCALSIHRTRIGSYLPLPFGFGGWTRTYD